jgi:maleate cis-trans isomerase
MDGWRARLGFLLPPGNPNIEPEIIEIAPKGVSVHFGRMITRGVTGALDGLDERTRSMLDQLDEPTEMLAHVKPNVIALAHTASSYMLGREGEIKETARLQDKFNIRFTSAFASVIEALNALGIKRVALGAPYGEAQTLQGKAAIESYGIEVVNYCRLQNVRNIYEETAARAYSLAREANTDQAQAIFLSGVGMPTIEVLDALERDLGKPVISSVSAMIWNCLRIAGVQSIKPGFGQLLEPKA